MKNWCRDDECGRPLPDGARADAEFCSGACRQRTYRRRRKLLAPYHGDVHAAMAAAIDYFDRLSVTDSRTDSRNAEAEQ